jgi:hypothetical protein
MQVCFCEASLPLKVPPEEVVSNLKVFARLSVGWTQQ